MSVCKCFILDSTAKAKMGSVYKEVIENYVNEFFQESKIEFFLDNLQLSDSAYQDRSARFIIDCDYFLCIFDREVLPASDQLIYAGTKNKKVILINANDLQHHREISRSSLDSYMQAFMQKEESHQNKDTNHSEASVTSPRRKTRICGNCGGNVSNYSIFCENCGANLSKTNETTPFNDPEIPDYSSDVDPFNNSKIPDHNSDGDPFLSPAMYQMPANYSMQGNCSPYSMKKKRNYLPFILSTIGILLLILILGFFGLKYFGLRFFYGVAVFLGILVGIAILALLIIFIINKIQAHTKLKNHDKSSTSGNVMDDYSPMQPLNSAQSSVDKTIFISYSHHSKHSIITEIIQKLKNLKFCLWFDQYLSENIGDNFNDLIAEQIISCQIFMPMISQEYVDSSYCTDELYYARFKNKKMIPVFLEDVILTPGLEMRLIQQYQIVKPYEFENKNDFYQLLLTSVNKYLEN